MLWITYTDTPLGPVRLTACEDGLSGLSFENTPTAPPAIGEDSPVLAAAKVWLAAYFAGEQPSWTGPLAPSGTPWQRAVWARLLAIPYGTTTTYGAIAQDLAAQLGRPASPRAVGGAVGANPIALIIPCHRVVAARGLGGYAAGLSRKEALLRLEKAGFTGR